MTKQRSLLILIVGTTNMYLARSIKELTNGKN
jgi:hypothetical protein